MATPMQAAMDAFYDALRNRTDEPDHDALAAHMWNAAIEAAVRPLIAAFDDPGHPAPMEILAPFIGDILAMKAQP